ncbi:hypothetical protein KKG85_00840 [Patescibacteria group bacterium]|nr:hypothetical protein [Patescibacteria group bacterium]MBU2579632.1 hypothetical protein [Patescibacteria group bacterium]
MHKIQQKILGLAEDNNLADLTLRRIGELIGEKGSPQKIKHHLGKLIEAGLLLVNAEGDKIVKTKSGVNQKDGLISLPILGDANCGQALSFADDIPASEFVKVSIGIIGRSLAKRVKDIFVLRAVGDSMNRAKVSEEGKSIEEGDLVLVDKKRERAKSGDYVVSIIDGCANIKKLFFDKQNKQVVLLSESSRDYPPIYIHENDYTEHLINGLVVDVLKKPDELSDFIQTGANDVLKDLGLISKKEVEYYENL